jgi:glycosyltransferase involved in cell wall biosynthesis
MKIIQANKFLYPKGGADKYCLTLIDELSKLGDNIIPFGMADKRNIESPWGKYFSENIDYHKTGNTFKIASRLIWNKEAANKFATLLDETKPNLIHAHNIYHQLSPSILVEAKKRKIPVVMTLHDYKLICPNYLMFTHGKHCERCLPGNYLNCFTQNCYYSYTRSGLAALESFLHNKVWHSYKSNVDLFISPSNYLKEKLVEAGWDTNKITVLTNPAPKYNPSADGSRLLYIGRLSVEKGVDILLQALKLTNNNLDIAGTGPDEEILKKLGKDLGLDKRVIWHGQLLGDDLERLKREAKAVILPSIWAENMSLVLLESLAYGKLIIASASGGTPELIEDNKTGFLFPPGDAKALAKKINDLENITPEQREELAHMIKEKIEPLELKNHLNKLEHLYSQFK